MGRCTCLVRRVCVCVLFLLSVPYVHASETRPIKIVLDADRTRHVESAKSIEMGIKAAFDEVGNKIQGRSVEFVPMDHRGNSTRSKMNMEAALEDPDALLVVAGLHSPPLIKNRTFINESGLLTLVPWAAGGPVTRYPSENNWIFRLSIDDTKAGIRIAEHAVKERSCKSPFLLLEQTPWGASNRKTMEKVFNQYLGKTPPLEWFNWGISKSSMRIILRNIHSKGADCIVFVGNANDGKTLGNAILSLDSELRIPVLSHWGITGGDFVKAIPHEKREGLNLEFIQTCFSFVNSEQTDLSKRVFNTLATKEDSISEPKDLMAPAGFIHAYDLGRILIQALSQMTLTDDMVSNRTKLKNAFEDLTGSVSGLIKNYEKPFSVFSEANDDAHEALGLDDLCMARFGPSDEIILYQEN